LVPGLSQNPNQNLLVSISLSEAGKCDLRIGGSADHQVNFGVDHIAPFQILRIENAWAEQKPTNRSDNAKSYDRNFEKNH